MEIHVNELFFLVFAALGYVILQSLFILGVRIAAKGGTEVLPDGRDKDSEMILYPLFKYLSRVRHVKVYYSGEQWDILFEKLQQKLKNDTLVNSGNGLIYDNSSPEPGERIRQVLKEIDEKISMETDDKGVTRCYKTDEEYVVNKYFRKPVIQCPICMASYWSVFGYWIPMFYFFGFQIWIVYFGILNICAVSCVNWLLWMRGSAHEALIMKGK